MTEGPRLRDAFRALGPAPAPVERMRAADAASAGRPTPSLAREWLDVLRAHPVANAAWIFAAAAVLLATSPLAAVLARLARGR